MKKYIIPSLIAIMLIVVTGLAMAYAKSNIDRLQNQVNELSQQTPQAMLENIRDKHSTLSGTLSEKNKKIQELELAIQEEKVEEAKIAQEMKLLESKSHNIQALLSTGSMGN